MSDPTPDEFGRYRVSERVDGRTRHYSTKALRPGVHRIVPGPASYPNGDELPPKFNVQDGPANAPTEPTSPKGA